MASLLDANEEIKIQCHNLPSISLLMGWKLKSYPTALQSDLVLKQNYKYGLTGETHICLGCNLEHILKYIIERFSENYSLDKYVI